MLPRLAGVRGEGCVQEMNAYPCSPDAANRSTGAGARNVAARRSGEDTAAMVGGDDALAQIVARWAASHPGQRLVLTIDQFEELATLCRDDAERTRSAPAATAVEERSDAFRLILALRTDFEPRFTDGGAPLAEFWQAGRYVVPPMDIEDLYRVIEGPASLRVLYFDPPELVDELVAEVVRTPDALPLLSFVLSELYVMCMQSGRENRTLSGSDYLVLGGVLLLRAIGRPKCTTVFRMTLIVGPYNGSCCAWWPRKAANLNLRRVPLSEPRVPVSSRNARVKFVLDRLVDARLLVQGHTAENRDGYVEPIHTTLVVGWDKLLRWKTEAKEYLPLQRRLTGGC